MKHRIRQLPNGKFVGEIHVNGDWKGCDAKHPRYCWPIGYSEYKDCLVDTYEKAEQVLQEVASTRGYNLDGEEHPVYSLPKPPIVGEYIKPPSILGKVMGAAAGLVITTLITLWQQHDFALPFEHWHWPWTKLEPLIIYNGYNYTNQAIITIRDNVVITNSVIFLPDYTN